MAKKVLKSTLQLSAENAELFLAWFRQQYQKLLVRSAWDALHHMYGWQSLDARSGELLQIAPEPGHQGTLASWVQVCTILAPYLTPGGEMICIDMDTGELWRFSIDAPAFVRVEKAAITWVPTALPE